MPASFELRSFPDEQALAAAAATDWLTSLQKSSGSYSVALSGGRAARIFFVAVANLAKASGASLAEVRFFWADERCVGPADSESNFRLARESLLQPMGIAADKIHRLKGEIPPAAAVAEASSEIRRLVPFDGSARPVLDLVFLGMGEDGHIASLMPNAPAAVTDCKEPYAHVSNSPKPPSDRLTMTFPILTAAKNVWVLITGVGKKEALRESLRTEGTTPLARVLRSRQRTIIYSDLNEMGAEGSK